MEFRILGPVEVWAGGARVDPGPPRQRGILAALAVDAGRPVAMDTVVDRVWGPAASGRTRHTLHVYVGRIRRDPRRGRRRSRGGPAPAPLRRLRARHRPRPGRRACASAAWSPGRAATPTRRSELLREALDLWRGTPLADVPGEWADRVRAGWERQRVDAVVAWAQAELRLGRPDHVIATVGELVTEYPLVEPLIAVQMRALAAAGRGAEALEVFARTRQQLVEQLGVDPGADLRVLHQAMLRGEFDGPARAEPRTPATPAPAAAADAGAAAPCRRSFRWTSSASPGAPTSSPTSTRCSPPPTSSGPRW